MRVKGSLSHLPPWHQAPVPGTTGASRQALLISLRHTGSQTGSLASTPWLAPGPEGSAPL